MIVFRYKRESLGKGKSVIRPVADVFVQNKSGSWIEFHPYIDSGADVTMIPLSLGKLLGLKVEEAKIEQIGGIRGSVPVIYVKQKVRLGGVGFLARIAWALVEEVPPLLGRESVFDKFKVTFKQRDREILFEEVG